VYVRRPLDEVLPRPASPEDEEPERRLLLLELEELLLPLRPRPKPFVNETSGVKAKASASRTLNIHGRVTRMTFSPSPRAPKDTWSACPERRGS